MGTIEKFEDILAWQKSQALSVSVYKIFKTHKDYSFRDQILRATVSIPNNIAEGFERHSNKELKHFLFVAKGSAGEVRSMLHLAKDLGYVSGDIHVHLVEQVTEISKLLSGFIKTL